MTTPKGPNPLAAMLQARNKEKASSSSGAAAPALAPNPLAAMLKARGSGGGGDNAAAVTTTMKKKKKKPYKMDDKQVFEFDPTLQSFLFFGEHDKPTTGSTGGGGGDRKFVPTLIEDKFGNLDTDISVPLAPCIYRLCDYTYLKKEPILLSKCIIKLNVLRCLLRECQNLNALLKHRNYFNTFEEEEIGKTRFMELLSNCGICQLVSELLLKRSGQVFDAMKKQQQQQATTNKTKQNQHQHNNKNPYRIPQIHVYELQEFLQSIDTYFPELEKARQEIYKEQSVSFYPGLGELFCPGSKLICHPEGMEGMPMGCSCVQSYYAEDFNKATNTIKRRFILVIEFIVSVGDELVFVAATDVYPEFNDLSRNCPVKDLSHRKLFLSNGAEAVAAAGNASTTSNQDDIQLLQRLQQRGEFYASVATKNHYLEYLSDSFFPILGGWNSNAVRPLSKGGRVMVDVKRGIIEGHLPIRGSSSDGLSDTVKEAIKLWDQSKRTGIAVPFRSCILPGFVDQKNGTNKNNTEGSNIMNNTNNSNLVPSEEHSDSHHLWQSWPMLTGFSFTARVWGKLLLAMPKATASSSGVTQQRPSLSRPPSSLSSPSSPSSPTNPNIIRRQSVRKMGVELAGLGGEGACGNCGYIEFQEHAFDQLVLAEDKKELIRAVARNAGGGVDDDEEDDEYDEFYQDVGAGIDVIANKGAASIFLLHGPPGCGKTLTAEAIAELLRKPLYVVTAGDLGITAKEVEKTLGSVLDLCQTWDALVLIDEADVFLEARTSTELQRNALVCVMLRLLEYYSGCLFLSSNRPADSIDAAIASRITVMLGYPPLDIKGRAKVWKNLIELVPALPIDFSTGDVPTKISNNPRKISKYRMRFSESDYNTLASGYELNGRQIKNSIVLARALARERGKPLSVAVLDRAVTAVVGEKVSISI